MGVNAWCFALALVACGRSAGLRPRADSSSSTTIPVPLNIPYSQHWDGYDGPWSSFAFKLGSQNESVRFFPSTKSTAIWAVSPLGCSDGTYPSGLDCDGSRGGVFDYSASSSWENNTLTENSVFSLHVDEDLGYGAADGLWGYDSVSFGWSGGPTLMNQTIAAIAYEWFWLGVFPLNPRPTNFTNLNIQASSTMQILKDGNYIPSLSWGYTAGAKYQADGQGISGSLTLGGYDVSRFDNSSSITVQFPDDQEKDLTVTIQSIKVNIPGGSLTSLLSESISAVIDSTVSYLYLPESDAVLWENAFGIIWDNDTNLYLVNDTLYDELSGNNQEIRITLSAPGNTNSDSSTSTNTITVVLPIAAFLLETSFPNIRDNSTSYYFPVQKSNDTEGYILGRAFLQEAYVIYDYERRNFNVSPCTWPATGTPSQTLLPIYPRDSTEDSDTDTGSSSNLSPGAIAGAVIGGVCAGLLLAFLLFHLRHRRKRSSTSPKPSQTPSSTTSPGTRPRASSRLTTLFRNPFTARGSDSIVPGLSELPQDPQEPTPAEVALREHKRQLSEELDGSTTGVYEMYQPKRRVLEMEGDVPLGADVGGGQGHARQGSDGSQSQDQGLGLGLSLEDVHPAKREEAKQVYEMDATSVASSSLGSGSASATQTPLPSPPLPSPGQLDAVARREREEAERNGLEAAERRGSLRSLGSLASLAREGLVRRESERSEWSEGRSRSGTLAGIVEEGHLEGGLEVSPIERREGRECGDEGGEGRNEE